ncbi:MAG: hypothetical protein ACRDL5_09950, partial [Solirubrobacteraceae bacterium]
GGGGRRRLSDYSAAVGGPGQRGWSTLRRLVLTFVAICVFAAVWSGAARASTFTVTNNGDNGGVNPAPAAGTGTLRQAIVDLDALGSASNTIDFAIPGSGLQVISLAAALPVITNPVTIDGYSQGAGAAPLIDVDGTSAGGIPGLMIDSDFSTIEDIAVTNFSEEGIMFSDVTGGGCRRATSGPRTAPPQRATAPGSRSSARPAWRSAARPRAPET